jgi:hypothetical protein
VDTGEPPPLPSEAISVVALVAFAAVRLVSLHQVDALLYRRRIHGVKVDAVIELAVLATAIVLPLWHPRPFWPPRTSATTGQRKAARSSSRVDE